jgi:protein-disulfide isomerase
MKGAPTGHELIGTLNAAEALGINSTPTLLIGNQIYVPKNGMPSVEDIEKIVRDVYGK